MNKSKAPSALYGHDKQEIKTATLLETPAYSDASGS
jgi:hypothetical protein